MKIRIKKICYNWKYNYEAEKKLQLFIKQVKPRPKQEYCTQTNIGKTLVGT